MSTLTASASATRALRTPPRDALSGVTGRFSLVCLVLIFVFTLAGGNVLASHYLQHCDTFLMLWVIFGTATLLFTGIFALQPGTPSLRDVVRCNARTMLLLNLSTAVSWVGGFYAIRYLEPAIANALTFAISPFIVMACGFSARPRHAVAPAQIWSALGILGVVVYFVLITLKGWSGVGTIQPGPLAMGILASAVCSASVAGNTLFSKKLSADGVSASSVLSTRFYLLTLGTLAVWLVTEDRLANYTGADYTAMITIAVVGMALPLYLLQRIIERTSPMTTSFIVILGPVATYLLEFFDPRLRLSPHSLLGIAVVVMLIVVGSSSRHQKIKVQAALTPQKGNAK